MAQVDKAPSVKRFVADFCGAAVAARNSPSVISTAATTLTNLIRDEQVAVAKQALQAGYAVLRVGLAAHAAMVVSGLC
jgi:hypothetical protein